MSSLLAGLALRGAGLVMPHKSVLALRGRARFEPIGGFADADTSETASVVDPDVSAPPSHARISDDVPSPMGAPRSAFRPPEALEPGEPPIEAHVTPSNAPLPPEPPRLTLQAGLAPVSASPEPPVRMVPAPVDLSILQTPPILGLSAETRAETPPGESKPAPRNAVQRLVDHLATTNGPADMREVDPAAGLPSPVNAAVPDAPAAEPPRVTVSIDRIHVIIEAPPSRPAPVLQPAVQAIGFASYARIRRGTPR